MSLIDKSIIINCPMNIRDVYERVKFACFNITGMYVHSFSDTNFSIFLQTKVFWFFGENINITCHYLNNGLTQIKIINSPKVPTTLIDFGKGKKNLKKIVDALRPVLPSINAIII